MCWPDGPPTRRSLSSTSTWPSLRRYRGIAIDVGDQDGLRVDAGKLHQILDRYGIANSFEVYPGTHTSAVADRFQNHVLPFMSRTLCFRTACR